LRVPDGCIAYLRSDTEEKPEQNHRRPDFGPRRFASPMAPTVPRGSSPEYGGARREAHGLPSRHRKGAACSKEGVQSRSAIQAGSNGGFPRSRTMAGTSSRRIAASLWEDAADYPSPFPVYVMNMDGSNHRVLFQSRTTNASGPVWSPQGDRMAFGLRVSQPSPGRFGPALYP
jgi:hypothetical protein